MHDTTKPSGLFESLISKLERFPLLPSCYWYFLGMADGSTLQLYLCGTLLAVVSYVGHCKIEIARP